MAFHQLSDIEKQKLFNVFITQVARIIQKQKLAEFFQKQLITEKARLHEELQSEQAPSPIKRIPPKKTVLNPADYKRLEAEFIDKLKTVNRIVSDLDMLEMNMVEEASNIITLLVHATREPVATVASTVHTTLSHMAAHIAHGLVRHITATPAALMHTTSSPVAGLAGAATAITSAPSASLGKLLPVFAVTPTAATAATSADTSALIWPAATPELRPSAGKKERKKFADYFANTYSAALQQAFSLTSLPTGLAQGLRGYIAQTISRSTLLQELDQSTRDVNSFIDSFLHSRHANGNTQAREAFLSSASIQALLTNGLFSAEPVSQSTYETPRPAWIMPNRRRQT